MDIKATELLLVLADVLKQEGWTVAPPSRANHSQRTYHAVALAREAMPVGDDDIEYDVRADWLTDSISMKVYSTKRRAGLASCLTRDCIEMPEDDLEATIRKKWSDLRSALNDNKLVANAKAEKKKADAVSRAIRNSSL